MRIFIDAWKNSTLRKCLGTIGIVCIIGIITFFAGATYSDYQSVPQKITVSSACPATGCASGDCHTYSNVPNPDGIHEMVCPIKGCTSTYCHKWDNITHSSQKASDASLNAWILIPTVLFTALVLYLKRSK